jgi:uncharacterized repeat protein (TIGR03803 family)
MCPDAPTRRFKACNSSPFRNDRVQIRDFSLKATPIHSPASILQALRSFALVCALLLLIECRAHAAELYVAKGHVPRTVASLRPLGRLESSRRIDLAIGLPLRNRQALTNLLSALYDSASPSYRQYLTPQQFADRFGPTEEDYQAVISFAKSNHLALTATHPNRMLLDVNGAVADIERALHLNLRLYLHPTQPRAFYSPDVEPSLDARIPILSISGLDDFFLPRPMDLKTQRRLSLLASGNPVPAWQNHPSPPGANSSSTFPYDTGPKLALNATGSGPSGTFIGTDFRAAYAPGVLLDGTGESIGLFELDTYYPGDISQYENLAGLPSVPLTNVPVNGFSQSPGENNGEVALDIEMAISMAPGLSHVVVYEGTVPNDVLNRMATDNQARQLSCSWTFGAQVDATREQIFQQFAAQGQSFFQASGDAGAYGTGLISPSDDPFVTSVGGTSLTTSPGGNWSSEVVWPGSGGGISPNYPIPVWQRAITMAANQGSTTMRNVPDVAALADAVIWVVDNNGEQATASGTSVAAPLWAGFAALINQQAAATHQPAIGFINPAIYALGQGPAYASAFHDISSGNNTNSASQNRFFAVPGYDLCTGWGSPAGSNLINALLAPPDSLQVNPSANSLITSPVGGPFTPALQVYSVSNFGAAPLSWSLGSTSAWLNISPVSGALSPGGPAASLAVVPNSTSTNLSPGTYLATLWFTNLNDGFYQRRQVTLDVVTPPVITGQPASQTLPTGATAQFILQTATNSLLSFQWLANGTKLVDGNNVAGSMTSTLTLSNVTLLNNGNYSALVSNVADLAVSSDALLTVTSSAPVIVTQPIPQTALPGANATFSVDAVGDQPLSYYWRASGTNLIESGNVSGSTSSILTLKGVSAGDANVYSVVVSNALGVQNSAEAELKVVSLTTPELVQTSIYPFTGGLDGGYPNGLTRGIDSQLYGTTQSAGSNASGTIFQLDAAGLPKLLYSFTGAFDGDKPNGDLIERIDGSLLGTTYGGGSNAFGTIFTFNTNSGLTSLFSFDHTNGVLPAAGLVLGNDGNLYGTAYEGGIFHYGVVFRLNTNGAFAVLFPFGTTNGAFPHAGLTLATDGSFYGTTYKGGAFGNGTIFRISPDGLLTTLASFNGTNGAFPLAGLIQAADSALYGTTAYGGAFGLGTVFRITSNGLLTNLFSFTGASNGSHPAAALFQASDGNLYGTTTDGGAYDAGTVFRMPPAGALTTIAEFDGFNGSNPDAALVELSNGSFYGTTRYGGPNDQGVIFRLSIPSWPPQITSQPAGTVAYAGATVVLSVASFGSSPLLYQWQENGTNLVENGNISGSRARTLTLSNVSAADNGSYSVIVSNAFGPTVSASAVLQVLVSPPFITSQPTNQTLMPGATAILNANVLGDLPLTYQWRANGTNLVDAGNLSGSTTDTLTINNATEANNGIYTLFATNLLGAVTSSPAALLVVTVTAPGTTLNTLHWFTGSFDGRNPSELVDGADGYLYGTTQFGGTFRDGTIFALATNGGFSTLVSFDQTNGAFPLAGLVRSTNGSFYGTTSGGGASGSGSAFAATPSGVLTSLYAFTGGIDGASPNTTLVQASDGNFYGSTSEGGANGFGTILRITPEGVVATLHSFTGALDGAAPSAALLQAPDGQFYGSDAGGGEFTNGYIFSLSPNGSPANLYSFTGGTDGYTPVGSLILGDDSALYGATRYNTIRGFAFYGTLFKFTTNGAFTTLYALNFTDGSYPAAGLVLGTDGNFYGTTEQGGPNDYGTVFRMTPSGVVSSLVEFDGFNDGAHPLTALTQGSDGNLYGTTSSGGPGTRGTVFRLSFTGPPQLTAQPVSQTAFTGRRTYFSVAVTGAAPLFYRWQKNGTNLIDGGTIKGTSARVLTLSDLTLADAGAYSVLITNASGSTNASASLSIIAAPPVFQTIFQANGALSLVWSTAPGRTYQLQSKPALTSTNWVNVGPAVTAIGDTQTNSASIASSSQQFYRVILLP